MDEFFQSILNTLPTTAIDFMAALFVFVLGTAALFIVIVYCHDRLQTRNAILNNYPFLGHFRYIALHLGEFFRRYFSNRDWDGLPFSRAVRQWISDASHGDNLHIRAFGSTKPTSNVGDILFTNATFPAEACHDKTANPIIGPNSKIPFEPKSFFNISAMSYGSLSKNAILALSHGAAQAGCWLNTGEGGLSSYHLSGSPDIVFQMGTAKYGVRDKTGNLCPDKLKDIAANPHVKLFEIKLSQGAKPGKGGVLPAEKVSEEIAAIRAIEPHKASISPNRHREIANTTELLEFIQHIRELTGKPTGIKMVLANVEGLSELCQAIQQQGIDTAPDFITIDGGDGGTGAAPSLLMDAAGLPLSQALPLAVDTLSQYQLRERIRIIASGKLVTSLDVAWGLAMGADYINSARGFMFALGCIQAMRCHKNTCPTGITTHNKRLQRALKPEDKATRVAHYVKNMTKEVEMIANSCGLTHPRELTRAHMLIRSETGKFQSMADYWPNTITEL